MGEIVQWVKYLLDKNENLSLYPEHSCSERREQLYIITLEFAGWQEGPSTCWQASLVNQWEMQSQSNQSARAGKPV